MFANNNKRPGRYKLKGSHSILTSDASLQRVLPRRTALGIRSVQAVRRDADSASPHLPTKPVSLDIGVVLVKKKDGSMRFAIDNRRLNLVTKRDEYSLPNPQSIFDRLEGRNYFSKLDIASAYWAIPIASEDVKKTAFHTPRGMYEMLVMPFGLYNAQATFQRVMDCSLDRVPHCESYVDDILIFLRASTPRDTTTGDLKTIGISRLATTPG